MTAYMKLLAVSLWILSIEEFCSIFTHGQFPYPEPPYYPPYPPSYYSGYMPPPYPYYPPSYGPPAPTSSYGYRKPKYVKPLNLPPSSPLILPGHGFSNTPIIISSKPRPAQPPTLFAPLTNLINSFIRSIIPRPSCDCDCDY